MNKTLLVVASVAVARLAHADIVVKQSGGVTEAPSGAPAVVTFQSDERVVVRQVTDEMTSFATSSTGATASAAGDISRALCTTPCTLEMPPGFMRIRFGDTNPMNANKAIDFNFQSGPNTFRIKPFQSGKFIGGFLMAVFGGSAAIVGTSCAIIMSDIRVPMAILGAVGAGVTIGGAVMIVGARADAERVAHDPSIR